MDTCLTSVANVDDPLETAAGKHGQDLPEATHPNCRTWGTAIVAFLCLPALALLDAHTTHYLETWITGYVEWTASAAPWSLLLYSCTTVAVILCSLPLGAMLAAAGPLFTGVYGYRMGLLAATLAMGSAELLAAVLALLVGRSVFRKSAEALLNADDRFSTVRAASKLMAVQGVEMTMVMRLAPLPSGMLSYVLGCTEVRCVDFALGTLVVEVPYAFAVCFASSSAMHWSRFLHFFTHAPLLAGCFVAAFLLLMGGMMLRTVRRYNEILESEDFRGQE